MANSKDGLTAKARQFIALYTDPDSKDTYLNATESVFRAYNCKSRQSASAIGHELVKKYLSNIESKGLKSELTSDYIVDRLKILANNSRRDSDKIRSLELLGKSLGIFKDSVNNTTTIIDEKTKSIDDIDKEFQELIIRRQKENIPTVNTN